MVSKCHYIEVQGLETWYKMFWRRSQNSRIQMSRIGSSSRIEQNESAEKCFASFSSDDRNFIGYVCISGKNLLHGKVHHSNSFLPRILVVEFTRGTRVRWQFLHHFRYPRQMTSWLDPIGRPSPNCKLDRINYGKVFCVASSSQRRDVRDMMTWLDNFCFILVNMKTKKSGCILVRDRIFH